MQQTPERQMLQYVLPKGSLEWFEITSTKQTDDELVVVLTEKNLPPLTKKHKNKKVVSKGFKNITITDFPLRGRRTLLTFRRRYWQAEGEHELLKRDIKLVAPGTQLEHEFASFLKEDGGRGAILASHYRKVSAPPDQRI